MQVVRIGQQRNKEVANALRALADLADRGAICGVVYVVKYGPHDHRAGDAGDYRRHPVEALQATFMMERHLRADIEEQQH
jgi:hypothetical protein